MSLRSLDAPTDAVEAGGGGFLEGVLPDADDFPALTAELARDAAVAGHVVFAFAVPEGAVGLRARVALGAAVPETTVDKDGDFLVGERKVVFPGKGRCLLHPTIRPRFNADTRTCSFAAFPRGFTRDISAERSERFN